MFNSCFNLNQGNPGIVSQELVVVLERAPSDAAPRVVGLHEHEELVLEVDLRLLAVIVDLLPETFRMRNLRSSTG